MDSGAVGQLSKHPHRSLALIVALREEGLWPPTVPAVVLVECLQGHAGRDPNENRFPKTCGIVEAVAESITQRKPLRGSAVDALVVAIAEPGGTVLTSDQDDLQALAAHATDVQIERI